MICVISQTLKCRFYLGLIIEYGLKKIQFN
jgi:hypothetical protein